MPGEAVKSSDQSSRWLLAGCMSLFTARLLIAGDLGANAGQGLLLDMLWIFMLLFWSIAAIRAGSLKVRFTQIDGAVLGLFTLVAVFSLYHMRISAPRPVVNCLWEWCLMGLAYFLLRQAVTSTADVRAVFGVMIAFAVSLSALGYFQYTVDRWETINRYEAIKHDRLMMLEETGHWSPPDSPERKRFEDRLHSSEPFARFTLANSLAGYLAPWLVVLAGIAVTSKQGKSLTMGGWLLLLLAVFIGGCLFLTKSRSGVLAVLVGLGLLWFLSRGKDKHRWRWPLGTAAGVLLLGAGVYFAGGLDREVFTQAGRSLSFRLQYWQAATRMLADHPVSGVGLGQFQLNYTRYKLPEASEEISDPHNFLLELASLAGVPALLLLLLVIGLISFTLYRRLDRPVLKDVSPEQALTGSYRFAGGGALAGLFIGLFASMSAEVPIPIRSFTILLLMLLVGLGAMLPWIRAGKITPSLALVGMFVLLVNLLAAGSLIFPGVAGSLWILIACGASLTDNAKAVRSHIPHLAYILASLAGLVGIMCYLTAYWPTLSSADLTARSLEAQQRGNISAADDLLSEAVAADPYSAQLAHNLAQFRYRGLGPDPGEDQFREFEQAAALARERSPLEASIRSDQGRMYLALADITHRSGLLKEAEARFKEAISLYPTGILPHAALAVTLEQSGRRAEAVQEANVALRLETIALQAGHADKQIPDELRQELLRIKESSD